MNLQEKNQEISLLSDKFAQSTSAFLVDYQGVTCEALKVVRRELKPVGAEMAMVKNTLAKRAVTDTSASVLNDYFVGPTAVVWSKDVVGTAKVLSKFAKDQEKFSVRIGLADGQVVDKAGVESLANLPSKQELYAKLLGLLNAPATRLLQTMNAPASSLARLLAAWNTKRGE